MSSDIKLKYGDWIHCGVDPTSNKVTTVYYYKNNYMITLDPTTNTTTVE